MDVQTWGRGGLLGPAIKGRAHASGLEESIQHGETVTMPDGERGHMRTESAFSAARLPPSWSSWNPFYRAGEMLVLRLIQVTLLWSAICLQSASAASINFENCLSPNIINSNPVQLQFQPLFVYASFNSSAVSHGINVTVYGNVTGKATQEQYPAWNDPQWANPNATLGKIPDVDKNNNKFSTLTATFNVLDYTPYDAPATQFCNTTVHGQCPLGPAFMANG